MIVTEKIVMDKNLAQKWVGNKAVDWISYTRKASYTLINGIVKLIKTLYVSLGLIKVLAQIPPPITPSIEFSFFSPLSPSHLSLIIPSIIQWLALTKHSPLNSWETIKAYGFGKDQKRELTGNR